jgi:branched-chain amino acid aminotransferase
MQCGLQALSLSPLQAKDLIITPATVLKEKPDPDSLVFGATFTDHMLTVEWSSASGWEKPHIKPFGNLPIHPAASVLHYAVEVSAWEHPWAVILWPCKLL